MKKIFYNGTILTMEDSTYAQAVLIENGIIIKTDKFEPLEESYPDAQKINLKGNTMLPAFIDAHGHFSSYANAQLQIPLEESYSFDEISEKIKLFLKSNDIKKDEWIIAKGYDHNILAEKRHPNKELLDAITTENPIVLQHKSGHCGVFNSAALKILGITADTPSPFGGMIGRAEGKLTGYMEEQAFIDNLKKMPLPDYKSLLCAYAKAQKKYLSYGITTVQEGMMVAQMLPLYKQLLESNLLTVDVIGYSETAAMEEIISEFPNSFKKYDNHFKIGGYKIFLDGSPQVKTAWMRTPYKDSGDYCGYGTMSDTEVVSAVETSADKSCQILAHCNGDAAVQQYLNAVAKVASKNEIITSLKPVIIHSQLITKEQLPEVAKLNMIPSFFVAHILHWGDIHIKNFGLERAASISPANSALKNNIIFTFHQDAPVIEPNMLETIQSAVTRKTKSGVTLGENERISVLEALKAVTINAAYQYSEEDTKGSIKEGKRANFVILNDNPLVVPPDKIKDISVLETIIDGETLFIK